MIRAKMSIGVIIIAFLAACGGLNNHAQENRPTARTTYACWDDRPGARFDFYVGFGSMEEAMGLAAMYGNPANKSKILYMINNYTKTALAKDQCGKCGFYSLASQAFDAIGLPWLTEKVGDSFLSAGWWAVRTSGYCNVPGGKVHLP